MEPSVTLNLKPTFGHLMAAKLYVLFRRSIWIYLACSFVIAFAKFDTFSSYFGDVISIFIGILTLSLLIILISSKVQAMRKSFDADFEFSNAGIKIHHRNKDVIEEKEWTWITDIKDAEDEYIIATQDRRTRLLFVPKRSLDESQKMIFENQFNATPSA